MAKNCARVINACSRKTSNRQYRDGRLMYNFQTAILVSKCILKTKNNSIMEKVLADLPRRRIRRQSLEQVGRGRGRLSLTHSRPSSRSSSLSLSRSALLSGLVYGKFAAPRLPCSSSPLPVQPGRRQYHILDEFCRDTNDLLIL